MPTVIVRPTEDGYLVITQADHARLAADFLSLVRLPELIEHPQREELLRAVAEHDNGWWEPDAAPRWDPETGAPLDFRKIPSDLRREIWTRGVERYATESPGIAARIATHALRLYATFPSHREDLEASAFTATLAQRRKELRESAGLTPDQLATDDTWLRLADEVSLAACNADATLVTTPGWHASRDDAPDQAAGDEILISPFPLAGATRLSLRTRVLLRTTGARVITLGASLAAARWESLSVRFAASNSDAMLPAPLVQCESGIGTSPVPCSLRDPTRLDLCTRGANYAGFQASFFRVPAYWETFD